MISSSDKYTGIVLGELLSKASEYINQKNKVRNYYHSLIRNLEKELKENSSLSKKTKNNKLKQLDVLVLCR